MLTIYRGLVRRLLYTAHSLRHHFAFQHAFLVWYGPVGVVWRWRKLAGLGLPATLIDERSLHPRHSADEEHAFFVVPDRLRWYSFFFSLYLSGVLASYYELWMSRWTILLFVTIPLGNLLFLSIVYYTFRVPLLLQFAQSLPPDFGTWLGAAVLDGRDNRSGATWLRAPRRFLRVAGWICWRPGRLPVAVAGRSSRQYAVTRLAMSELFGENPELGRRSSSAVLAWIAYVLVPLWGSLLVIVLLLLLPLPRSFYLLALGGWLVLCTVFYAVEIFRLPAESESADIDFRNVPGVVIWPRSNVSRAMMTQRFTIAYSAAVSVIAVLYVGAIGALDARPMPYEPQEKPAQGEAGSTGDSS